MRLLDRYLLRELLIPLSYCLGGILIFWISFDLIAGIDDLQRRQLTALDITELYLLRLPEIIIPVAPIALLLALLYALTNHARHHELTAIRAAGVSLWRLSLPYLGLGVVLSCALFVMNELIEPICGELVDEIMHRREPGHVATDRNWHQRFNLKNTRENRYWSADAYNKLTCELVKPSVLWQQADGSVRQINAERGGRVDGVWTFFDVQELYYSKPTALPEPSSTNRLALPEFAETPEQIKSELKISSLSSITAARRVELSVAEIWNYMRLHPQLPANDAAVLHTQLHARLAMPWTSLVVVLIALPFGAKSGRRNVFAGVASSIFICFAFYVIQRTGLALGTARHMIPWIAAWAPDILFGAAGIWMTWRVR